MPNQIRTRCCVVGGGPAGIMLGALLARAGIDVVVLEKHGDFFRDFRGDTIHPSTLELLDELGLLESFLKLPHQQLSCPALDLNGTMVPGPDLSRLPTRCKFIAIAPQWDFLNFIADYAKRFPGFQLLMKTEATSLIREGDRVTGVSANSPEGELEIFADLVVAADGRRSILREQSRLPLMEFGVPIDVLWFRLPKPPHNAGLEALGHISSHRMMITIDRGDYLQCGMVIAKNQINDIRQAGIPAFRTMISEIVPPLQIAAESLENWDQIKLLTVQLNRLKKWYLPGLLLIGDAAHAMSPAGGVGVNLAIQDAVATANLLAPKLASDAIISEQDLKRVQQRREWPTLVTQNMQKVLHRVLFDPRKGFGETVLFSPAGKFLLRQVAPIARRVLARMIGIGVLPEHIHSPEFTAQKSPQGDASKPPS